MDYILHMSDQKAHRFHVRLLGGDERLGLTDDQDAYAVFDGEKEIFRLEPHGRHDNREADASREAAWKWLQQRHPDADRQ